MSDLERTEQPEPEVNATGAGQETPNPSSTGLTSSGLSPSDLALLRELAPKLSPKGREIINLLLAVFSRDGRPDLNALLQMAGLKGGDNSLSSLTTIMPLISSLTGNQSGNQGLNPAMLASLLNLLNR
ncbi:MAG: hypothetical protein GX894_03985 [Clostridia bacterium]|nr:hypothetical protein [Clostridia bacterium]